MKKHLICLSVIMFLSVPSMAYAIGSGGFENATFSAKSLAQSDAVAAQADEPATISYNPAGITQLPGIQVQGNTALISGITSQHNGDDAHARSTGTVNVIPTGYVTINPGPLLGDRVAFGVGSDSPFGLSKKYDSANPIAHYAGYDNWLKMYTIKPVAAIKLADWLSIGGGPIYYRIYDFYGVEAYPNAAVFGAGTPDGQVRANLSGNTWGWHLGALVKPHKKHQLGFYFRSPVDMHMRGRIKVERATMGGNFETGANAKVNLPLSFTFAYAFKPTDRTTLETDFTYTRWSIHRRLYINADPVNAVDDAILNSIGKADKDWSDSFLIALGGNHKFRNKLTLMSGIDFRWTPVPNSHFSPAVPDSNRLSVGIGVSYPIARYCDVSIAHYSSFSLPRRINNDSTESLGTSVDGTYFSYLQDNIVSVTLKWDDAFTKFFAKKEDAKVTKELMVGEKP